jgi:hypothetical protein
MDTVKIRCSGVEQEIPLRLPQSFAARRAIVAEGIEISTSTAERVAAAALGLCWAHEKWKLKASFAGCKYDVLSYGGLVLDELGAKFWVLDDVVTAGVEAWTSIAKSLRAPGSTEESPRSHVEDVVDLADFTAPQTAPGTPSETSLESSGSVT